MRPTIQGDRQIVLGVDPGYGALGYGVIAIEKDRVSALDYGCLTTPAADPFPERLNALFESLTTIIASAAPSRIAIEKLFFEKNTKTAIDVSQARGVIMLAAVRAGLTIVECTPLQVKLAVTGYGKAEKKQVQHMMKLLLKLPSLPRQDDAADALAIAYCGAFIQ